MRCSRRQRGKGVLTIHRSWWINPLFAYHSGIIDSDEGLGRVVCDESDAYAIALTGNDEIDSPEPGLFTYRARPDDPGKYRLTAGTHASRHPIRILRSHTLRSLWAPRAGIRYDGL